MTENSHHQPIFQPIFGKSWAQLPPVMHKHYANRPFSRDSVIVKGRLDIKLHWLVKMFAPLFAITKTLVPKAGSNIETVVNFASKPDSAYFCLEREFSFPDGQNYNFFSCMEPVGGNEVVEWTSSGIGWRAAYSYDGDQVILQHRGYCIKIFGRPIPLPFTLLFGRANAEERAISDIEFSMFMNITHPLFGELYSYGGTFEITEMSLDA